MTARNQTSQTELERRLVRELATWPSVSIVPHRFNAVESTLGGREIGHVHQGQVLDINFPNAFMTY